MAHSNRKKLREARGGKTRNQYRKAQRAQHSAGQGDRLHATISWIAQKEAAKDQKVTEKKKMIKFEKSKNSRIRRASASERLKNQLTKGLKPGPKGIKGTDVPLSDLDVQRIKREIKVLEGRI